MGERIEVDLPLLRGRFWICMIFGTGIRIACLSRRFFLTRSFLKEGDVDFEVILYSMKIKEQTRKLAAGCSKHCFEVVDKTDEVSSKYYFEVADGS